MSEQDQGSPAGRQSSLENTTRTPRNLVICCDGTANEARAGSSSNVFRLVQLMRGHPEQQRIYYDPGLGTESSPSAQTIFGKAATKVLGLAFGYGLRKNIVDAYTYLMNHYQPGDRIFMFGFSRGAYTVRAIAGMLETMGLLEGGSENLLFYAIRQYSRHRNREWADIGAFKGTLCRQIQAESPRYRVPIHFLGVWDTVKSIGIFRRHVVLPYTNSLPNVSNARHAVSLAEKRSGYRNKMWTALGRADGDCQTVWFPGAHSDVGGSYPATERGLADFSLGWMIDAAEGHGLLVNRRRFEKDSDRRRGRVRVGLAQERAREGQGQWLDLVDELGKTLTGARSWTRKLEDRFSQPDVQELAADLEDGVKERFERTHNPLIPYWWVLGWWSRKLPERAWIHRCMIERIARMSTSERSKLDQPLNRLSRVADGGQDVELVDRVLIAQLRQGDGTPGDVLIQTLNPAEAEAVGEALGQGQPSAVDVLQLLRVTGLELWRQELDRQEIEGSEEKREARKKKLSDLLAAAAEDLEAGRIKGDDGAFAKLRSFLRKRTLSSEQEERVQAAAPYLLESLAEWPGPG